MRQDPYVSLADTDFVGPLNATTPAKTLIGPGADLNNAHKKAYKEEDGLMCEDTVGCAHKSIDGPMMPLEVAVSRYETQGHEHVEDAEKDKNGFSTQKVEHLVEIWIERIGCIKGCAHSN